LPIILPPNQNQSATKQTKTKDNLGKLLAEYSEQNATESPGVGVGWEDRNKRLFLIQGGFYTEMYTFRTFLRSKRK
jgi:hypothetical protein